MCSLVRPWHVCGLLSSTSVGVSSSTWPSACVFLTQAGAALTNDVCKAPHGFLCLLGHWVTASRVNSHCQLWLQSRDREGPAPSQEIMLFEHCWQRLQTPQLISDVLLVAWRTAFPSRKKLFPATGKGRDCLLI